MEIPRVTSDWEARQEEQVLDGLGAMGAAHMQQRMVAVVPTTLAMPGWTEAISMVQMLMSFLFLLLPIPAYWFVGHSVNQSP